MLVERAWRCRVGGGEQRAMHAAKEVYIHPVRDTGSVALTVVKRDEDQRIANCTRIAAE